MTARDDAEVVEAVAGVLATEGWCCDPYGHEEGPPSPGECSECDSLRESTARALLPLIREREAAAWERALREAADKWQTGAWTALTEPIKAERQAQRIIGAAQVVLDWLRDRAAANPYAGSEGGE